MLSLAPAPTESLIPLRKADFATLPEGLDYAASGATGLTFYDSRARVIEVLTYRNLRDKAVTLAQKLLALGLRPGDRVGILGTTDSSFVQTFFACQYAGLVPATLPLPLAFGDQRYYIRTLRRMLDSIEARAVFASGTMEDFARQIALGPDMRIGGCLSKMTSAVDANPNLPRISAEDLSYLQFSSGSTRSPMAIAVTQRALMSNAAGIICYGLQVRNGDRAVSWLPFYHDMGLVGFLLTPLLSQLSVDLIATSDFARRPLLWPRVLSDNGGTLSYSPSFGYELCAKRLASVTGEAFNLERWRVAGVGGDMIRSHVLESFMRAFARHRFDRRAFVASYGLAEMTLAVSFAALDQGLQTESVDMDYLERAGQAIPATPESRRMRNFAVCGPLLPGHEVEIRDESDQVLVENNVGRIFVRGPSVMREYWNQQEETAKVLSSDGWLNTGDLGFLSAGRLVITGRAKDIIVVNGRNLLPQDLEWSAEQQGELRSGDVAAFSVDQADSETIVLLVQCRLTEHERREELRQAVVATIHARHGVDVKVVLVPPRSLPKTSSGKLRRSQACMQYLSGQLGERLQSAPELQCALPSRS